MNALGPVGVFGSSGVFFFAQIVYEPVQFRCILVLKDVCHVIMKHEAC